MSTPYDAFTDSIDVVTTYILNLLKNNASALQTDPEKGFYYGEQELFPTSPTICAIPGPESSTYAGIGGRPVQIVFQTFIMVYIDVVRDVQLNTRQAMQLATVAKHVVHADKNLGGNVLDCYCTQVEPGYALKKNTLMAAARITFTSKVKKILNP